MKIDEDAFIADVRANLSHGDDVVVPPGDDCACIRSATGQLLLMAVDQVVGDVHYFGPSAQSPTSPELAGRKLLARNLSDIAAMGGTPSHALISIAWPKDADRNRLDAFMNGVVACAKEYDVDLIGGDLCASATEVASLTIVGTVEEHHLCLRANAQAGDRIFVTGQFGGSLGSGKHLTFTPRLEEGRWVAAQRFSQCMIDVSDGLVKDVGRIAEASGLQAFVDGATVPVTPECDLNQALGDGEDYELVLAVSPTDMGRLIATWPFSTPLTDIGYFDSGTPGRVMVDSDTSDAIRQYDHFAAAAK